MIKGPTIEDFDVAGIVGSDAYPPIYMPDAQWKIWEIGEVYFGHVGKGKYVPKVKDLVRDIQGKVTWEVVSLDAFTYIPELVKYEENDNGDGDFLITGLDNRFRLFYDKSTVPETISPDGAFYVRSDEASYARIYRGRSLEDHNIISQVFNNSGEFIGTDIKLSEKEVNSHDYTVTRTIPSANTNVKLKTGEECSVVIFSDRGRVIQVVYMLVDETTFFKAAHADSRYIMDIGLKSAFVDPIDPNTINLPSDMTINSFSPIGVVYYSDGTSTEYAMNSGKFRISNLGQDFDNLGQHDPFTTDFTSITVGADFDITLLYKRAENESTIMAVGYDKTIIPKPMRMVIVKPQPSYGVKLYAYPVWIGINEGYELNFYLVNLNRDTIYNVTHLVRLSDRSAAFNGSLYGMVQTCQFDIELSDVSLVYGVFNYTQVFTFLLRGPGDNTKMKTLWEVGSQQSTLTPMYGEEMFARISGTGHLKLNIGNGIDDLDEFLERTYYRTSPLVNRDFTSVPPVPTHMSVRVGDETIIIKIEDYGKDIVYKNKLVPTNNSEVIFYQETVGNWLVLSVINMPIRYAD